MRNILSYTDFINEDRPHRITINGRTNTITIDKVKYRHTATNDIFKEVDDITRTPFIKELTGGYKGEFDDIIRNNISIIEKVRNTAKYPEEGKSINGIDGVYYIEFPEKDPKEDKDDSKKFTKDDLEFIFNIKPKHGDIGSGEVLFAAYYSNVKRNLLKSQGGEAGDCTADVDGQKVNIEIKAADSPFKGIDHYTKEYNIHIDENILDEGVKDDEKYPYVAGLAAYIYRQKKDEMLHFILFDNKIREEKTMKGYLTFIRTPDENIESIINRLMKITEISSDDKRGGKKSRDFTISYENDKIQIHKRKKE